MNSENAFESLALAYDAALDWDARLQRELPFIIQSVGKNSGKAIDLACGSGRHATMLAQKGFAVVGIDSSADMIQHARAISQGMNIDIEWHVDDMLNVGKYVQEAVNLILCLGNSLALLESYGAIEQMMSEVHSILDPSGVFIFQVLNADFMQDKDIVPVPMRVGRSTDGKRIVFTRFFDVAAKEEPFRLVLTSFIESEDGWTSQTAVEPVQRLSRNLLEEMLEDAGFSTMAFFSDYKMTFLDTQSSRSIIVQAHPE